MQWEGKKKWQNWAWDPEYAQLLPMALPGMEGIHVRALVEKEGEKGQKQERSRNQASSHTSDVYLKLALGF